MKTRSGITIALIVSLLILAGCSGSRTRDQQPRDTLFRTGTEGIVMRFSPQSTLRLFEKDEAAPVEFILEVRNRGAFPQGDDLNNAKFKGAIFFGGFDKKIITLQSAEDKANDGGSGLLSFDFSKASDKVLEGKSPFNLDGGIRLYPLKMFVKEDLPAGTSFYNPKLRAAVNYYYETIASAKLCVDPDPRSTRVKDKPCTFTESIGLSSQGAPVAVTTIQQDATSSHLLYKIYIKNVGRGRIIDRADERFLQTNPFEQGFSFNTLDNVFIGEVKLGNVGLECRPSSSNTLKLIDNTGYVLCQVKKEQFRDAAETLISVKLEYGYTDSVETSVEVLEKVEFANKK
ncbi:hypothetical protein HYU13_05435 [Candidatus Woesearchaeota archaeon]|nr:hypothetical protein [Candidatus Woesearchaeota archaeon]